MVIQYLRNKNNHMLYKAVNNSLLLMWSPKANAWIKSCTKYSELFIDDYLENFDLVDEKDVKTNDPTTSPTILPIT